MKVYSKQIWKQLLIDAPFHWYLRVQASHSPVYSLKELAEVDKKLEAFLDALKIGLEYEPTLESTLHFRDEGSVFVFSVVALRTSNDQLLKRSIDATQENSAYAEELYQAVLWEKPNAQQIDVLNEYEVPEIQQAIVATFPGNVLHEDIQAWLDLKTKPIILRMLDYVGRHRLKRYETYIRQYYGSADKEIQYSAIVAGLLVEEESAIKGIRLYTKDNSPKLRQALQWLFSFVDKQEISNFIDNILSMKVSPRIQALSIAYSGVISLVPKLFEIMKDPNYAQVAGEAFSILTGIDITEENLDANTPEENEKTAKEKRTIDEQYREYEEDLPWPDLEKIKVWWSQHISDFDDAKYYLAGKEITLDNLSQIMQIGKQAQRAAAAIHLAKIQPTCPFVQTTLNTLKQIS